MRRLFAFVFVLTAAIVSPSHASDLASKTAHCSGVDRPYLYYSPVRDTALPAVMLLHGAGDHAVNMMNAWQHFAAKQKIVLLAPELPRDPRFEDLAPDVFHCVTEDVKQFVKIDPQRVYLFGNSMGGYLAFDGAMFQSQYFAAVAVHANRIAEDYVGIVARAKRKTPIAIYIGDSDQFFSLETVRKTRDFLLKAGFPVHYIELEHHDHNYYALADEINADAWKFMKQQVLLVPKLQP